jgi:hypothetical protein
MTSKSMIWRFEDAQIHFHQIMAFREMLERMGGKDPPALQPLQSYGKEIDERDVMHEKLVHFFSPLPSLL